MKPLSCGRSVPARIRFILFAGLLFANLHVFAQGATMKYELKYVQKKETYYVRTDVNWEPTQADIINMLPVIIRDSIIEQVTATNDIKSTIYHLENNQWEDWMTQPAKTVVDKVRVRSYDAANLLLTDQVHSAAYLQNYNALKDTMTVNDLDIIPDFPFLSTKVKQDYLFAGYTMTKLPGGDTQFASDTMVVVFNNKKYTVETRKLDETGAIIYYKKLGFKKNASAQLVPSFILVREQDLRFPPGLVYKVHITTYTNYTIFPGPAWRAAPMEDTEEVFVLYPNPVTDHLLLEWSGSFEDHVNSEVVSSTGTTVLRNRYQGTPTAQLDVSDLASGIYIVTISNENATIQEKFVKY
jgi:hypothetical protein